MLTFLQKHKIDTSQEESAPADGSGYRRERRHSAIHEFVAVQLPRAPSRNRLLEQMMDLQTPETKKVESPMSPPLLLNSHIETLKAAHSSSEVYLHVSFGQLLA